jgi:hypothetical protein
MICHSLYERLALYITEDVFFPLVYRFIGVAEVLYVA